VYPAGCRVTPQVAHRSSKLVECGDKTRQCPLTSGRQADAFGMPHEQGRADLLLQRLDLRCHGSGCNLQFRRGLCKPAEARGRFERSQCV
jgi:hypothetical protein